MDQLLVKRKVKKWKEKVRQAYAASNSMFARGCDQESDFENQKRCERKLSKWSSRLLNQR